MVPLNRPNHLNIITVKCSSMASTFFSHSSDGIKGLDPYVWFPSFSHHPVTYILDVRSRGSINDTVRNFLLPLITLWRCRANPYSILWRLFFVRTCEFLSHLGRIIRMQRMCRRCFWAWLLRAGLYPSKWPRIWLQKLGTAGQFEHHGNCLRRTNPCRCWPNEEPCLQRGTEQAITQELGWSHFSISIRVGQ